MAQEEILLKNSFRTDLACESRDLWASARGAALAGLSARSETRDGFGVEIVEITDNEAEEKLCKPKGRYVTIELDALVRREEDAFRRACGVLARELRTQLALRPGDSVLVAGLGNPDITPDAVGPLAAEHVLVTRHLKEKMPDAFSFFRPVGVLRTGVLGTTGVESAALCASVVSLVRPACVIAVDALCARETARLCRAVQISDAGIIPGSGVGNARSALTAETLGVPVVAVGVPTVVDARTLCADLSGAEAALPDDAELFVTPRDIDSRVRDSARLVGYAVDLALHDALTIEDIDMYLS